MSSDAAAPATATPQRLSSAHKVVLTLLLVSAFVVMLNETIVGVALPTIMKDLGVDPVTGQFLVTAYMLTMAIVIPLTGFLMKRFTTRAVFIGAIGLFTLGTAVGSLSAFMPVEIQFGVLLVARILQASGTGVMTPLLMTSIMTLVPPARRGVMMGLIGVVISVAPVLGPLAGGVIVTFLPWPALFDVILPLGVIALLLGIWKMVNITETSKVPVDVLSIILSILAFGGLVYGLSTFGDQVADSEQVSPWVPIGVGLLALAAFVFRQLHLQKTDSALIDLRIFQSSAFTWAVITMVVMNAILFGSLTLLPFYIQEGLQADPLQSGLMVMPGGLLMGLAGPIVGGLYDKIGPRPLVIPGAFITTIALWLMAFLFTPDASKWTVVALYMILCVGLALLFSPLFTVAMAGVKRQYYTYASAGISTVQQIAGALGTSVFMVIYTLGRGVVPEGEVPSPAAVAEGTHGALLVAAFAAIAIVVLVFFIRKPAVQDGPAPVVLH
ncbi:MAG TPA: MDR family MFS transporter [Microbacteriaceae bacterium]|nr:MDR family MFS transporter [Microbacteriaceae bacterium]